MKMYVTGDFFLRPVGNVNDHHSLSFEINFEYKLANILECKLNTE